MKPVVLRRQARQDIQSAAEHYALEADEAVAEGFLESLEAALAAIGRRPATGSPRVGVELGIPGLRSRRLGRFPFLIFYLDGDDQVEVWRVLHRRRDIPAALANLG